MAVKEGEGSDRAAPLEEGSPKAVPEEEERGWLSRSFLRRTLGLEVHKACERGDEAFVMFKYYYHNLKKYLMYLVCCEVAGRNADMAVVTLNAKLLR